MFFSGDMLLSHPDKYLNAYRNWTIVLVPDIKPVQTRRFFEIKKKMRGYPSLVKGAGFRVPSRRRSQVQLLLHAFVFFIGPPLIKVAGL